jgi:hypothetical protein
MPSRTIVADGTTWNVYPSGFITPLERDEFGLIFVSGAGDDHLVRVTRYSPQGARSREQSLGEMPADKLAELFRASQPSATSPEAGYLR